MSAPTPLPIRASTAIDATPDEVWSVVSDVTRMPEFSPELRKVITLGKKRGLGQNILGLNRRKAVWWPTTSKVVRWEQGRVVAWKTRESGATWTYEITPADTGVRLTATRELDAFTLGSKLMTPILGGAVGHDEELAAGLATTLDRIKAVVEG